MATETFSTQQHALQQRAISYREAESRDVIGFGLWAILVILLPIQRPLLPLNMEWSDGFMMLLSAYGFVMAWRDRQRLVFPLMVPFWLVMIASLIAMLTGFGDAETMRSGIVAMLQEIYLYVTFLLLVNHLIAVSYPFRDRVFKIWTVVAALVAVTAVLGMFRLGPAMFWAKPASEIRPHDSDEITRAVATFANANAAAVYLSVSVFVALITSWPMTARVIFAAWIFVGMYATGSNGAMFSTLLGLTVLMSFNSLIVRSGKDKLAIAGIAIVTVSVVLLLGLGWLMSPMSSPNLTLDTRDMSLSGNLMRLSTSVERRVALINWAWPHYLQHPLGTGPNSFWKLMTSLHNDYIAFLFERGPLGLIAWLWLVGGTLVAAFRAAQRALEAQHRWQVLALGTGFLAVSINAFTHEVSHMRQVWLLMAFLFASVHIIQRYVDERLQRSHV